LSGGGLFEVIVWEGKLIIIIIIIQHLYSAIMSYADTEALIVWGVYCLGGLFGGHCLGRFVWGLLSGAVCLRVIVWGRFV